MLSQGKIPKKKSGWGVPTYHHSSGAKTGHATCLGKGKLGEKNDKCLNVVKSVSGENLMKGTHVWNCYSETIDDWLLS